MHAFPLQDFTPRTLIDRIVNSNNSRHVLLSRTPALALHGIEKHLRRGVHPVRRPGAILVRRLVLVAARYVGGHAPRRKHLCLAQTRMLTFSTRYHIVAAVHARVQENHHRGRVPPLAWRHWACRLKQRMIAGGSLLSGIPPRMHNRASRRHLCFCPAFRCSCLVAKWPSPCHLLFELCCSLSLYAFFSFSLLKFSKDIRTDRAVRVNRKGFALEAFSKDS